MKTETILPMSLNMVSARLFSIGRRITRRASFILVAFVNMLLPGAVRADTHYVNAARPDDSGNGLSWATAERTIQAAINAAMPFDMIVVTNGVYTPISTANRGIKIQSVNGVNFTIIDGGGTNRCATLGSFSNHTNTILAGFTLRNGYASPYGGGSYYGTLNNCSLMGNRATWGGGSYYGTLNNCTLFGNSASSGGGSYYGTLNNCIVWGNTLPSGVTNNYFSGTLTYSCTDPLPAGAGNLSADPLFRLPAVGDYRLLSGSPCLNAGTNGNAVGTVDGLGNPRIQDGTVDMGAFEGAWTLATDAPHLAQNVSAAGGADGISVSWTPPSAGGALLYRVCRMDVATGQWTPVSGWITNLSFLDSPLFAGVIYRYAIASAFDTRLDSISGLSAFAEGQRPMNSQFYVDASRPDDAGNGQSWATAKKTIQGAIDVSVPFDTILVTNGVYSPISTANKAITIQSINGSDVTVIDGGKVARCATLGSSSSHTNTVLVGFTLQKGYTSSYGGGSCYGTLSNCTLTGNSAYSSGGGAYYGMLHNCTLTENSAIDGGGSDYGTLNNCILIGNSAFNCGGGSNHSTLYNCTLTRNSAWLGDGSYFGTLNNCIVWGNPHASVSSDNYVNSTFRYSCTLPLPSGPGNLSSDPLFRLPAAGDYRLSPGSPCLDKGANGYAVGTVDGLGNPRIQDGTVDMGACEGAWTLEMDEPHLARNVLAIGGAEGVAVSWDPPAVGGAVLYRVCRMDFWTGQWSPVSGWITELGFLDKQVFFGVIYRYAIVSAFDARLDVISGLSATAEGQRALPQLYVDASRPSDAGDGRSWTTAKKTIQAAIGVSAPYDTILVANGVYAPISTANKMIAIKSVNGMVVTIIDGGGTNRCATLGSSSIDMNTVLIGFTLRNGFASDGGGSYLGTLNNCTLSGNSASSSGGGSYYSTLNNCTLTGNSATSGGGSCYGRLNNCTLTGNSASSNGGGSCYNTLHNCTLLGNSASNGGGSYYGGLNNCIVWGNTLTSGVTNNYSNTTFKYSCTAPLPSWTGNISVDPLFADAASSNFILRLGSPCINTGTNAFVVGTTDLAGNSRIQNNTVDMGAYEVQQAVTVTFDANGGLLATGQAVTNLVGNTGDIYDSWLTLSNGISRVGYTFAGWFTASIGGTPVLSTDSITAGRVYAQWILAPPIIPGNPNVSSNFLDTVTQAQIDALVAGLRAAHPDVTDAEIAKKFEDADLFGLTGVALVGVGTDVLVRLNPSITLLTLSVSEGDPRLLVVKMTITNNIDPTPAEALARIGEPINSRVKGVFKNSLSAGASEAILTPELFLDTPSGIIAATFTLESPSAASGFLRMSLRR